MRTSNRFRSRDRTGRVAKGGRELREAKRNQQRVGFFLKKKIGFRICIYKRPEIDPKSKIA